MAQGEEKRVGPEELTPEQRVGAMHEELESVLEESQTQGVAVRSTQVAQADNESDRLIQLAIERDADVDKLERLIELRNREVARQSKAIFEERFAVMQREFGKVTRTRQAKDANDRVMYAFAPLEDIVAVVGPTIADFGFRYRFEEERIEGGEKRVWCIVTGHGHEERTYFDVPIPAASRMTNEIQQRGSASSYGKRYAFLAAFGLTISDEDDDTQSISIGEAGAMLPGLSKIEQAKTLEELKGVFKEAFASAESESQKLLVIDAKNRRKEQLNARD